MAKPNKQGIIILTLAIFLIVAAGYISFDQYKNVRDTNMRIAYQQGITASVVSIYDGTNSCSPITLKALDEEGNQVQKQIVDARCLNSAGPRDNGQQAVEGQE